MINATRVGGFRDDDFATFGTGADYGLSLVALVGKPENFEHLVPSAGFLSWLMGVFGPHWWLAMAVTAGLVAALATLVVLIVRQLGGPALLALLSGAVVATSIVFETTALWWSAASAQLPMLVFAAATILLSLKWMVSRSQQIFAFAVVSQVAACSFYDRAQIVPVIVLVLLVVATPASEEITWGSIKARFLEARTLVASLFAVALFQLAVTLTLPGLNAGNLSSAGHLSAGDWWSTVFDWWAIGVASAVWNQFPSFDPSWTLINYLELGGILVLIAIGVSTIRNRRSAAIWGSAVGLITLSGIQVAALRVGAVGPILFATIARYQELTVLILAIFIPTAWVAAGRPRPRSPAGLYFLSFVAVIAAIGWTLNLLGGLDAQQKAPKVAASYARNFKTSLERWDATGKTGTFLDQTIPTNVLSPVPTTGDYNTVSKASRVLAPGVGFPSLNSLSGTMLTVDQLGVIAPVDIGPIRKIGPLKKSCGTSLRSADWLEPGGAIVPAHIPKTVSSSGRELILLVRMSKTTGQGRVFVTVSESSWPVTVLRQHDYPSGFRTRLPAGSTGTTVQFWLGAGGCIDSIEVAEIR